MILGCNPHDSPTFLHGRPETAEFDIIFNKRPYLHDESNDIHKAVFLKIVVVMLSDAERTTIMIPPSELIESEKLDTQEYHITVKFDLSEYERSASEKIVYA